MLCIFRQLDAFAAIVYPTLQECEYVNIICHFPQKPDVSKMFLLSGGKLQLDVVKSAFSVDNLIVILGWLAIILKVFVMHFALNNF